MTQSKKINQRGQYNKGRLTPLELLMEFANARNALFYIPNFMKIFFFSSKYFSN